MKKVLVVDDQDNWRKMIAEILRNNDYFVETASSFTQAISEFKRDHYDLAVIDVRLDDSEVFNVEGIELLEYIQKKGLKTKTLLMTGYKDTFNKIDIEMYGAGSLILKVPGGDAFDRQNFLREVSSLFEIDNLEATE